MRRDVTFRILGWHSLPKLAPGCRLPEGARLITRHDQRYRSPIACLWPRGGPRLTAKRCVAQRLPQGRRVGPRPVTRDGDSVPRYKFKWSNLPPSLLDALCRELLDLDNCDEDPAAALQAAYGARPDVPARAFQPRPLLPTRWRYPHGADPDRADCGPHYRVAHPGPFSYARPDQAVFGVGDQLGKGSQDG